MRENYPSNDKPRDGWNIGCVCGHIRASHDGLFFFFGGCKTYKCPKFKKDPDGIYRDGYYEGTRKA